ncbi:MAG: hypothetical protein IPL18_07995 [Sphingomonadales bacterium]|nr:hypothetical protein [Sphingomonadales bacterium]
MADRLNPQHRVFFAGTRQNTPLLDRIAPVRSAGFTAMSVWPGDVKGVDRCELRAALDAAGMVLTDLELIGNWLPGHQLAQPGPLPEIVRPTTPDKMLPLAAGAVDFYRVRGGVAWFAWDGRVMGNAFAKLCDQAADHGVRLAIEFVPTGAIADFARALELVERADRSNGVSWSIAGIFSDRVRRSTSWRAAPAIAFFRSRSTMHLPFLRTI